MPPQRPQRYRPITAATAAGALSLLLPSACLTRLCYRTGVVWPLAWTGVLSAITFVAYGYDKLQARNRMWRVSEARLHLLGGLGGWPGALVGMHFFQHKTKKASFQVAFWAIVMGWQIFWWTAWEGITQWPGISGLEELGKQRMY